ncbi:MAG: four helix bundle protein [Verrucomicrobiales bacterium]|nr:four helix bundle protein [Verrucomicrobiales bacterium]
MSSYVKHFSELKVYQKQRELARAVFDVTKTFPKEERFSLTDQIRRSSRSIGAQIAEAWAKRLYPKHFVAKLSDADGEQQETQHWITEAADCSYISLETAEDLATLCTEIGRMLGAMIKKADTFAKPDYKLQEEELPYLPTSDSRLNADSEN